MNRIRTWLTLTLCALLHTLPVAAADLPLDKLKLPPGFTIDLLARIPNARQMTLGDSSGNRVLYVGSREEGKVYALELGRDFQAGPLHVVAQGLNLPVGVAWRDGSLYVSAVNRILRLDKIAERLNKPPTPVVVVADLPTETHHGWKFIAFGPDGLLYVPVGAPLQHLRA